MIYCLGVSATKATYNVYKSESKDETQCIWLWAGFAYIQYAPLDSVSITVLFLDDWYRTYTYLDRYNGIDSTLKIS